jgi:hypothetical protein
MTRTESGLTFIWKEKLVYNGFYDFQMCCALEPEHTGKSSPIHFLSGSSFKRAVENQQHEGDARSPSSLTEAYSEYPHMLFRIENDGSICIWGLQVF